eukprot:2031528-Rhodomonas_salina.3
MVLQLRERGRAAHDRHGSASPLPLAFFLFPGPSLGPDLAFSVARRQDQRRNQDRGAGYDRERPRFAGRNATAGNRRQTDMIHSLDHNPHSRTRANENRKAGLLKLDPRTKKLAGSTWHSRMWYLWTADRGGLQGTMMVSALELARAAQAGEAFV